MVWYYETFVKVGRLKVVGELVIIEIDGDSVHSIPIIDVLEIISSATEIPLNLEDLTEGIGSLSQSHLGLKFNIPVDGQMYVAIVRQVINMIQNPVKKSALWIPVD